jgi:Glutamine amidotransferases class-II
VDFAKETTPRDVVTVVATRPLTRDEVWTVMAPGDYAVFRRGEPMRDPARRPAATAAGGGRRRGGVRSGHPPGPC